LVTGSAPAFHRLQQGGYPLKDTWLKLHTSLLTSAKFLCLPSNDHRWAFIALLLLAKKRLESIPERQLLGHINLSKRRWQVVKKDLVKSGLLDTDGTVNGFNESQLTPDALRMRQMRVRNKGRNKLRNSSTDSREQRAESRVREREERTPPAATDKESDYAKRLLRKHGIDPQGYLDNRGQDYWSSQMVDDVVVLYREAAVSMGPRPADTFTDDPDLTTEDIEQGKDYLARLNTERTG